MGQKENVESTEQLDKNERKKAKEKLETSEHEHYSDCGCVA
jgi:hypothetical protein